METNHLGNNKNNEYVRAQHRVKQLKGFYIHLTVYIVINIFISINIVISKKFDESISYTDAILNFETFAVWIFWGIGLAFHALKVFSFTFFFGKNWEERKIKQFMKEDEEQYKSTGKWM